MKIRESILIIAVLLNLSCKEETIYSDITGNWNNSSLKWSLNLSVIYNSEDRVYYLKGGELALEGYGKFTRSGYSFPFIIRDSKIYALVGGTTFRLEYINENNKKCLVTLDNLSHNTDYTFIKIDSASVEIYNKPLDSSELIEMNEVLLNRQTN